MSGTAQPARPPRGRRRQLAGLLLAGLLTTGAVTASTGPAGAAPALSSDPLSTTTGGHNTALVRDLRGDLESYLSARGEAEHLSAAGLSVSVPGRRASIDLSAGTTRFGGSRPVSTDSLWQIGSNTKAFTAVLILQLEAERRVSITDTVGHWLPQYPQWRDVTIQRLLNMTSGIPSYDEQPAFQAAYAADRRTNFSKERLISFVVGAPPTSGYKYSNTNYALAEMIIETVTRDSYEHQLYNRIIRPLGLRDLHYRPHLYPPRLTDRQPASYFFAGYLPEMASLMGQDVSHDTLSWARGAGGILATTRAMTVWERTLYGGDLLPAPQRAELFSLVSTATGLPIQRTSSADPSGFGLGVQQVTDPRLGTFWVYEGGTFGVRSLHVYLPDSGVIFAFALNSQPTHSELPTLLVTLYDTLVRHGVVPAAPAPATRA
jgi:D-alanyl-D-alanine carboxypeptidase